MADHRCINGAVLRIKRRDCIRCMRAEADQQQKNAADYEKQLVEIATFIGKDASHESGNSIAEVTIAEINDIRHERDEAHEAAHRLADEIELLHEQLNELGSDT